METVRELKLKIRETIVKLLKQGKSQCSQDILMLTIYCFENAHRALSSKQLLPTDRPRATSARQYRTLLKICKNMKWKASDDMNTIWPKISKTNTKVGNRLNEPGYHYCKSKAKPNLTRIQTSQNTSTGRLFSFPRMWLCSSFSSYNDFCYYYSISKFKQILIPVPKVMFRDILQN